MISVQIMFLILVLFIVGTLSNSLGSESESLLTCSKFHFEEKVLEKLVRMELKFEQLEMKTKIREDVISSKLHEINEMEKQTRAFVESVRNLQLSDQIRLNESYREIVQHFKIQSNNETELYGRQMDTLMDSLTLRMHELIEAEQKRESVIESMQFTLDQEKTRFNHSIGLNLENFIVQSNKTWQEFILKQQKVVLTGCSVGSGKAPIGSLKFPEIKTSIGVSDLSSFKSTGKFTCLFPGYYHIAVTIMSYHASTRIDIMRNSNAIHWQYVTGYTKELSYWAPGAAVVTLELKSNDNVWIKLDSSKSIYQSCLTIFKIN